VVKELEVNKISGSTYIILGFCDIALQKYSDAKKLIIHILPTVEKSGNTENKFECYCGLGLACEGLKDYDNAALYYKKAFDITEDMRSSLIICKQPPSGSVKLIVSKQ
jgi:tetratricopeptide (TPR) repeat protein